MKKVVIFAIIVIAIAVILGTNLFKKEVKTTPSLTKVSVALDWFPYSAHTGLFIAQERGYFAKEGLNVDLHTPSGVTTVLQTVSSGRDDFGISAFQDVLVSRAKGVTVASIMALVQHPLSAVMTLSESGITKPSGLVGKKIGATGNLFAEVLLNGMLKHEGIAGGIKDVEIVNVGFDIVPALISKKVDGIAMGYWIIDSIAAENKGFSVNIMKVEEYGVPDYYELVMITSEKKIQENKDLIQRFVRAVKRGYEDAIADPQGAVKAMKKLKPEVDLAVDSKGVDLLAPLWIPENKIFEWQEEKRWMDFGNWMKENGLISKDLDIKAAFNNSFVENAAKE